MSKQGKEEGSMKLRGDRNQCQGCKLYFNSSHAFERHRTGEFGNDRRCMAETEMRLRGMVLGPDGFWRGSAMPHDWLRVTAEHESGRPLKRSTARKD